PSRPRSDSGSARRPAIRSARPGRKPHVRAESHPAHSLLMRILPQPVCNTFVIPSDARDLLSIGPKSSLVGAPQRGAPATHVVNTLHALIVARHAAPAFRVSLFVFDSRLQTTRNCEQATQ